MNEPYYDHAGIQIYHGDCLEIMPELPKVDLVLTDPPYGVRKKEEWDGINYFLKNVNGWLDVCLMKSQTTLWFCADKMLPYILSNREAVFHRLLIWNKPTGSQFAGAMHTNIWYSMEPILVFGEHPKTDKTKKYGYSVFNYNTIPKKTFDHPTTKPLRLLHDLIYFYSQENHIILDPFMGSGTTLVAAKELGRKAIGSS